VKKHLEDRDKERKRYEGKQDRKNVENNVKHGINPVGTGITKYFEKAFHCCKDSGLT
jgi:hypothetical protein